MLSQHPSLANAMRTTHLRDVQFWTPAGHVGAPDHRMITVETKDGEEPLAAVSDQYRLLPNSTLVDTVERIGQAHGFRFEPAHTTAGQWRNGRSRIVLMDHQGRYHIPGDTIVGMHGERGLAPTIALDNDFQARKALGLTSGSWRFACCNLLLWYGHGDQTERVHKGQWSLEQWLEPILANLKETTERERVLCTALAAREMPREAVVAILEAMPERYRQTFAGAVGRYKRDLGKLSGWAVVNAATEITSHHMVRRGEPTVSGDAWLAGVLRDVLKATEIDEAKLVG